MPGRAIPPLSWAVLMHALDIVRVLLSSDREFTAMQVGGRPRVFEPSGDTVLSAGDRSLRENTDEKSKRETRNEKYMPAGL